MAHLRGEQVARRGGPRRRSPAGRRRAGGPRTRPSAGRGDRGRRVEPRRRTAATAGSSAAPRRPRPSASSISSPMPGSWRDRRLGLEPRRPADRRRRRAPPRAPSSDRRHALEPAGDRGQAVRQRRELAGDQREQAVAEQVDPVERVPGVLAELGLGEPRRLQLAEQRGRGRSPRRRVRSASAANGLEPAVDERQPVEPPGLGHVRPRRRRSGGRRSRSRAPGSARRTRRGSGEGVVERRTVIAARRAGAVGLHRGMRSRARRYHRAHASADVGRAGRPRGVARPDGAARARTTSTTCARSPSTSRSGAGRSWAPQDEAGLRRWVETALANAEAGTSGRSRRSTSPPGRAIGSSRYMSIVPEHKRLEIGWTWLATAYQRTGREPRGQAAPADPRLRDARRQPGRVQDPRPQRALADRARRDRRDVRGRLPPAT